MVEWACTVVAIWSAIQKGIGRFVLIANASSSRSNSNYTRLSIDRCPNCWYEYSGYVVGSQSFTFTIFRSRNLIVRQVRYWILPKWTSEAKVINLNLCTEFFHREKLEYLLSNLEGQLASNFSQGKNWMGLFRCTKKSKSSDCANSSEFVEYLDRSGSL